MKKIIALNLLFVFLFTSSIIIFSGCSNDSIINSDTGGQQFQIRVLNYSDNCYFLDTAYKSNFKDYIVDGVLNNAESIDRMISNENFEVWVQTSNTTADRKFASLLIDLPALLPDGSSYNSSFYTPQQVQGKRYFGLFRKLNQSEYIMNYQAGFISLKTGISENDYIGVAYKEIGTQKTYGTNSLTGRDTLVLKMMKAGNVNPQLDTVAWAMKMKNIYRIPIQDIVQRGFEFKIYYVSPLTLNPSAYLPGAGPLIEVMRLGQYIPPDITVFNFIPGRTIVPETGDVIFPDLEPFYTTVLNATAGDSTLAFKDLYTRTKNEANISPKASLYLLTGKAINPGNIPH